MKYAQDFDPVGTHSIRDNVRRSRHNEFSSPIDPPRLTQRWIPRKTLDRVTNRTRNAPGSRWIVAGNEPRFLYEIGQGGPQPFNAHDQSTSS